MVFYDIRPQFDRSIIILILHNHEEMKQVPLVHAKVTMSSKETFCAPVHHWKQTGEVQHNWHEVVLNHVLRITLSEQFHKGEPDSIQLSKESNCNTLFPIMPVFYDKRKRNNTFVACLQKALFSKVSPSDLVNFVELNRELGASIITIFFSKSLREVDKMYKSVLPYIESGLVEVIGWTLKKGIHEFGMSASATECVYRNINRARYMSLCDVDEFLIPFKHLKWSSMIDELRTKFDLNKYASLQFGNALISETVEPGPKTKCKVPSYFTRLWRNASPETLHPKVMVDLDTTISAYCHDIKSWKDGINKEFKVPFEDGALFHYRKFLGHRSKSVKKWIHDTTVKRYISHIIPSIEKHSCVTE